MSKRRATEQLQPAVSAKRHEAIPSDRARLFKARLTSLNQQFASWVSNQAEACAHQLWLDGVQQYQDYVRALLEEFKDLVGKDAQLARQPEGSAIIPDNLFSTPKADTASAAAAGGGSRDQSAAPQTGGSTGRKSVTWADANTALTPAQAANSTPNPNTAHAGHTPAPAGFGRFGAHTPGGSSEMSTPAFKLPGSAAATSADTGNMGLAGGDLAADQTPSSKAGGFNFGSSSGFGTPVSAAAPDTGKTANSADGNNTPAFSFGTPSTTPGAAGFTPPAATEQKGTGAGAGSAPTFTFGTPQAVTGQAAGTADKADTPTFGLAAGSSSGGDKAKSQAGSTPPLQFGVPQGSGAAAGSSPAFSFGVPSSSSSAAAEGNATAGSTKPPAFSFGVTSSSAAADGSNTAAGAAGGGSSGLAFNFAAAGNSGSAAGAASSSGGFSFGVAAGSSGGTGAGSSSSPVFGFASSAAASAAGGGSSSSTPAFAFGSTAGSAPAFGVAPFAFGSTAATAANGTPGGMFKFPAPAAAAGGGAAADGAQGVDDADGDDAAEQEEKTEVQKDSRWAVLHSEPVVLLISDRGDDGQYKWKNRGKCALSFRRSNAGNQIYIMVASEGQGKQLVCHGLRPIDQCVWVDERRDRVRMSLVNTLHGVKKVEGQAHPEPDVQHKLRLNIIKFKSPEAAQQFMDKLESYKKDLPPQSDTA